MGSAYFISGCIQIKFIPYVKQTYSCMANEEFPVDRCFSPKCAVSPHCLLTDQTADSDRETDRQQRDIPTQDLRLAARDRLALFAY